jgi:hypothetical protein
MRSKLRIGATVVAVAALALVFAAVAFAVKGGVWSGHTSQKYTDGSEPFAIQVSHNKITKIYYGAEYSGGSGCKNLGSPSAGRLLPGDGFKGFKIKHGKFSGKTIHAGDHVSVSGKFSGTKVTGTLKDSFSSAGLSCSTGSVTFSAKPGGSLTS